MASVHALEKEEQLSRALILRKEDVDWYTLREYWQPQLAEASVARGSKTVPTTAGDVDRAAILAAARESLNADLKRQERALVEAARRSRDIKARQGRHRLRERARKERELQLLEAASTPHTADTPQPQKSVYPAGKAPAEAPRALSAAPESTPSHSRSPPTHKRRKSFKAHREIKSQAELDYEAAQAKKAEREEINNRRLQNIERMKHEQFVEELERERRRKDVEQQALLKEERLLRQEIDEKRYHYETLDRIALPAHPESRQRLTLSAEQATQFSATLSSTLSDGLDTASQLHKLQELTKVEEQRRRNRVLDERWQKQFHAVAIQLERQDREIEHQKILEHLRIMRQKRLESLESLQKKKEEERMRQAKAYEEEQKRAQAAFLQEANKNVERFKETREEERKRAERMEAAKIRQQHEINEKVALQKAKDLEDLREAIARASDKQASHATEAADERALRILSVQKMRYAQYKREEEERRLRWEQVNRMKQAEEAREQELTERRRNIEAQQMRQAGNMLRFRAAQKEAVEMSLAENELFYVSAQRNRKSNPRSVDSGARAPPGSDGGVRSLLPRHNELRALESYTTGDVSQDILASVALADEKVRALQRKS